MSFAIKAPLITTLEPFVDSLAEAAQEVATWLKNRQEGEEPPIEVMQAAEVILFRNEQWSRM